MVQTDWGTKAIAFLQHRLGAWRGSLEGEADGDEIALSAERSNSRSVRTAEDLFQGSTCDEAGWMRACRRS
ncbi:MAG: hypothetical protein ACLTMP_07340 [Eggerthella lenta]